MSAVAATKETIAAPPQAGTDGPEMRAAEANRRFYADHAADYDVTESIIAQQDQRERVDALLSRAIAACGSPKPRTLDACGGTGNVSELLAPRGIATTVADVSPEMLALWREKAATLGVPADTAEGEIEDFLINDERQWDLIVFCSALHHLDDYVSVVGRAADSLAPGGVVATILDPTSTGEAVTPRLRRFDYLMSLAAHPRALVAALGRRSRRREEGGVNVGDIAEKHVLEGVDDAAIVARLEDAGLEVVEHRRYVDQRYRLTEWLMRLMKLSTTFHLIARKRQASPPTSTVSE